MDLNKVMLIGRITTDLEIKKLPESGTSVVNFTLATNRVYKNKAGDKVEEAEFHRCVVFGPLADMMGQYLAKGRKIFIEGRLRTRQWQDANGNNRYTTEIIVENMNFCDSRANVSANNQNAEAQTSTSNTEEDEIPF